MWLTLEGVGYQSNYISRGGGCQSNHLGGTGVSSATSGYRGQSRHQFSRSHMHMSQEMCEFTHSMHDCTGMYAHTCLYIYVRVCAYHWDWVPVDVLGLGSNIANGFIGTGFQHC